eukprot:7031175-Alexandrium_andersonii.AAC.1
MSPEALTAHARLRQCAARADPLSGGSFGLPLAASHGTAEKCLRIAFVAISHCYAKASWPRLRNLPASG